MSASRLLFLYLRSRSVPTTVVGLTGLLVITGWQATWLGWALPDLALIFVAVLAAVLLAGSFATPTPELDASAALPLWRWRTRHGLLGLVICAVPLAVTVAFHRHGTLGLDLAVLRNVLGFGGLALSAAALTGAWLAWIAPLAYALMTSLAWTMPTVTSSWARAFLWPVLPPDTGLSWWPALALCLLGTTLITLRGASSSIEQ